MAKIADTNRRKTASRRRAIRPIRKKHEPKIARIANQKLKGSTKKIQDRIILLSNNVLPTRQWWAGNDLGMSGVL
ncbi:hypothetical protein HQ46_00410 [Porphyromonas gulae]|nr:hypothetical protein HQ46_00410 [Porphyromonas gulae]